MTFVVIAAFIDLMIAACERDPKIGLIKKTKNKAFFYYDGEMTPDEMVRYVKARIRRHVIAVYVYDVYTIYMGMADLTPYLPDEEKQSHPYFLNPDKQLSDEEVEAYKQAHGLN